MNSEDRNPAVERERLAIPNFRIYSFFKPCDHRRDCFYLDYLHLTLISFKNLLSKTKNLANVLYSTI